MRTAHWKLIVVLSLMIGLCGSPMTYAQSEIKIGVLAKRGTEKAYQQWGATAAILSEKLSEKFTIVPLKFVDIEPALKNNQIHFLIANSGFFSSMEKEYKLKALTTMVNRRQDVALQEFGGVIFVRKNSRINSIKDIRGKRFMCVKYSSFGGGQMAWRLLLDRGINPKTDCSAFLEGGTHDNVVMAVKKGDADVGTVRSDTLERMQSEGMIKMEDFKIINKIDDSFAFVHSTRLYPEWPFVACLPADRNLRRQVTKVLMLLPNNHEALDAAKVYKWTYPGDYAAVAECLRIIENSKQG
jgi:ABC-type phosphate/phosphonate transport system substrate-binding protein